MLGYLRSKTNTEKNGSTKSENINKVCYDKTAKFGFCPDTKYICSQINNTTKMNKAFNPIPTAENDSKLEKKEVGCQVFCDRADDYPSGLHHISEVLTYYINKFNKHD